MLRKAEKQHKEVCARCGSPAMQQEASTVEGFHVVRIWGKALCSSCVTAWYAEAPATMLNRNDPGDVSERVEASSKRWEAWTQDWCAKAKRGAA